MADEYIRRENAKDALQEKVFHNLTDEFYGAMQAIDELPSADVAPVVHAHWVHDFIDANCNCGVEIHCGWVCSNCNWYAKMESKTNYCPDCGAKMDEEVQ